MRNPEQESRKKPKKTGTFSADDAVKKKQYQYHFITVAVVIFLAVVVYIFDGVRGEGGGASVQGLNTDTPAAGSVRMGRTKRENVAIAQDYNTREERRRKASSSSFDWFDNEPASKSNMGDVSSSTSQQSDEQRLAKAVERSDEIMRSFSEGGGAQRSGGGARGYSAASSVSSQASSSMSPSEEYMAKRRDEMEQRKKEQMDYLERMAAASSADGRQKTAVKKDEKREKAPEVKVDERERKKGFYSLQGEDVAKTSNIRAVVHGEHQNIKSGATVKLRLLDNIKIGETKIPKNTFLYGILSFSGNRAKITISNINYNNNIVPFRGTIYDKDGFEGIAMPENVVDNTVRQAGASAISSTDINISSPSSMISSGVNAVGSVIKSAVSGSVKEGKVSISTNYQVTIKPVEN